MNGDLGLFVAQWCLGRGLGWLNALRGLGVVFRSRILYCLHRLSSPFCFGCHRFVYPELQGLFQFGHELDLKYQAFVFCAVSEEQTSTLCNQPSPNSQYYIRAILFDIPTQKAGVVLRKGLRGLNGVLHFV